MPDRIVWKFTPVAHADDPRWLGRTSAETLYVAAPTSAEAIVAAAAWDAGTILGHVGNESAHTHSAFADEKLYRIDRVSAEEGAALGHPDDAAGRPAPRTQVLAASRN